MSSSVIGELIPDNSLTVCCMKVWGWSSDCEDCEWSMECAGV